MKTIALTLLAACCCFGRQPKAFEVSPPRLAWLSCAAFANNEPLPDAVEQLQEDASCIAGLPVKEEAPALMRQPTESFAAATHGPAADYDAYETDEDERASLAASYYSEPVTPEKPVAGNEEEASFSMSPDETMALANGNAYTEKTAPVVISAADKKISYNNAVYAITRKQEAGLDEADMTAVMEKAAQVKQYAAAHGYSTDYGFIADMGLRSGKKRFFVVDLNSMSVINSGIVAHGRGSERFTLNKQYSNIPGSRCTSLGLYKVGSAYEGSFGRSFKLYGLETRNSNAFRRSIVLHTMNSIPYDEIDFPIAQTEGCPSLAPKFMEELNPVIHKAQKPVLLYVFDSRQE
jgi:hypothetical protein